MYKLIVKQNITAMKWPPNKAWTSKALRKGYRHFVAINYGGKGKERWVQLVSVLDGKATLRIGWEELKRNEDWESGWRAMARDEANPSTKENTNDKGKTENDYLYPSLDSGLTIPLQKNKIRPWFPEE